MSAGTVFQMKGSAGVRYHGSYLRTPLEFRGAVTMSGPQTIGAGGVPDLVHQLFEQFPDVQAIGLKTERGGAVFQRLQEEPVTAPGDSVEPSHG